MSNYSKIKNKREKEVKGTLSPSSGTLKANPTTFPAKTVFAKSF